MKELKLTKGKRGKSRRVGRPSGHGVHVSKHDQQRSQESIAKRRQKRSAVERAIVDNEESCLTERSSRERKEPKRKVENGWYRVEGITNHRVNTDGKRDKFELKVNWEGYADKTWEGFSGFVKDTTPMVERYLIRSLLTPLAEAKEELRVLKNQLAS